MPELPEVEAVCRKLRPETEGRRIVDARLLRKPDRAFRKRVSGQRIAGVERRAKNILLHLDNGSAVRVHLRMTGNLYVIAGARLLTGAVRAYFVLDDGRAIAFEDQRALGIVEWLPAARVEALRAAAGVEPLSDDFTPLRLRELAARSRQPAKLFLMDQTRVAGLGNIYVAEILHRVRIHPAKPMNQLSRGKLERLHAAIVGILTDAVQSACIAYTGPGQFEAGETFTLAVYGRDGQPCLRCRRPVRRIRQGGRSTYFCPGCQRQ